jgi:hypothetical protein
MTAAVPRKPQRRAVKPRKALAAIRQRGRAPAVDFAADVRAALARGEPDAISDELLQTMLAAAVKLYAAKVERHGNALKPFADDAITATESVVAACAMIRAADLNIFDVAMWFYRPTT